MATYNVLVGINFPPDNRREPGETVTDTELPSKSVKWLLEQGIIEVAQTGGSKKGSAPAPVVADDVEEGV